MEFNLNNEKIFFNYSLKNPKYLNLIKDGFFSNKELNILLKIVKEFFNKFKEVPSKEQIKLLVQNANIREKINISDNIIDLIFDVNLEEIDNEWLELSIESWIKWKTFDQSLLTGIEYIKTIKVNLENVDKVINKFKEIINERNRISFNKDLGLDFFNPEHHYQSIEDKIPSGKKFVDQLTGGGYSKCSLIVYAGEQNIGKSIWLANDAAFFVKNGFNTAFISAEMKASSVIKRIGANLLDIPMFEYDNYSRNKDFILRKLQNVGNGIIPPGKLFIKKFPTSWASVIDIENYLKDVEESLGIKLDIIIIDYINILVNYRNPNSDNTYMKIKQISEDLRGMADRNNWIVITATQIKRTGYNASDISMEDIAESIGLAHTADLFYGIIQDTKMYVNYEYWLKILKIRDGEGKNVKCLFKINYDYMRLTETDEIKLTSL